MSPLAFGAGMVMAGVAWTAGAGATAVPPDFLAGAGAAFFFCGAASTLSGGRGVVWVCASAIVAGLAAARHAAVTSVVTDASFLTGPAFAGLRIGWRREPGMRTELIVPPMHVGVCVPRWCHWLAGGLPGYKATHARILDSHSQVYEPRHGPIRQRAVANFARALNRSRLRDRATVNGARLGWS